jgi:hypothetical protein
MRALRTVNESTLVQRVGVNVHLDVIFISNVQRVGYNSRSRSPILVTDDERLSFAFMYSPHEASILLHQP